MKKLLLTLLLCAGTLMAGEIKLIDQNASDPVYLLPLKAYPKWLCEAELENGKTIQFVSVKSMMQVEEHQEYFIKHKMMESPIKTLYVQDYMNGEKIDATRAVYVFGSKIVGPHGDDLIPLTSEERAKLFMMKNGGTKILPYQKLDKGLIRYLDM